MGKHLTNNVSSQSISGSLSASNLLTGDTAVGIELSPSAITFNNNAVVAIIGTSGSSALKIDGNLRINGRFYEMLLVSEPYESASMSTTYSGSFVTQEKWIDQTAKEIKRSDFAYSGSALASETVTVYNIEDGTSIVAQAVTTYAYTSGNLSGASKVRTV
jgi:hypothetical protein